MDKLWQAKAGLGRRSTTVEPGKWRQPALLIPILLLAGVVCVLPFGPWSVAVPEEVLTIAVVIRRLAAVYKGWRTLRRRRGAP